jgi:hypothetical protein
MTSFEPDVLALIDCIARVARQLQYVPDPADLDRLVFTVTEDEWEALQRHMTKGPTVMDSCVIHGLRVEVLTLPR